MLLLMAVLCWAWLWRNNVIFSDQCWDIHYVCRLIREMQVDSLSWGAKVETWNSNCALPIHPFVKLNVDGSFISDTGLMGVGGVLRDLVEKWKFGFSKTHC